MNNTKSFKKNSEFYSTHNNCRYTYIYCFEKKDSKIFRHEQDSNL